MRPLWSPPALLRVRSLEGGAGEAGASAGACAYIMTLIAPLRIRQSFCSGTAQFSTPRDAADRSVRARALRAGGHNPLRRPTVTLDTAEPRPLRPSSSPRLSSASPLPYFPLLSPSCLSSLVAPSRLSPGRPFVPLSSSLVISLRLSSSLFVSLCLSSPLERPFCRLHGPDGHPEAKPSRGPGLDPKRLAIREGTHTRTRCTHRHKMA